MENLKSYYGVKNKILVSLIAGGSILVATIVLSSYMKFYTDIIGLSPGKFSAVYLIFSIWNGINDPLIGFWADTQSFMEGRGKYKRLIRKSIPLFSLPVVMLLFADPSWNEYVIAIYLLVLMIIYEAAQTLLLVSFNAFVINSFNSSGDRTNIQVIISYVKMVPTFLAGIIPAIVFTGEFSNNTIILIFTVAILIGVIMVVIGAMFVKEDKSFYLNMEQENLFYDFKQSMKIFFSDKVFIIFILIILFAFVGTGNYFTGYIYYMDDVLNASPMQTTIPDIINGVGQMLTFPFIAKLAKKYGVKNALAMGLFVSGIGHLILTLKIGYYTTAVTYVIILLGYGSMAVTLIPIQGLLIDYLERKTGKRQSSAIVGITQMVTVPAASLQVVILGILIEKAGYNVNIPHTEEVLSAIRFSVGFVPAVFIFLSVLLLIIFPINKKEEESLLKFIENKNNN